MAYDPNSGWYPVLPDSPQPSGATTGRVLYGAGAPSNDDGFNGYAYINTTSGDLYVKYGDVWNVQGAAGGAGVGSPEGVVTADPGTTYVDTAGHKLWLKESGSGNVGWLQYV